MVFNSETDATFFSFYKHKQQKNSNKTVRLFFYVPTFLQQLRLCLLRVMSKKLVPHQKEIDAVLLVLNVK